MLAAVAALAACGRAPEPAVNAGNAAPAASAQADYQPAPEVTAASVGSVHELVPVQAAVGAVA